MQNICNKWKALHCFVIEGFVHNWSRQFFFYKPYRIRTQSFTALIFLNWECSWLKAHPLCWYSDDLFKTRGGKKIMGLWCSTHNLARVGCALTEYHWLHTVTWKLISITVQILESPSFFVWSHEDRKYV